MRAASQRYPLWTRGDLDGFFGLMVDNLAQVLLIVALCAHYAHLPTEFLYQRILPGVAVSLLIGNVFYSLQAIYVARKTGNPATTALPYGINTPTVIAYVLFIMAPAYAQHADLGPERAADLAWKAGLLACLVSGAIEFLGAFVAEPLRRATPRAALLGVLAAIGITFIAAHFAFQIYAAPLVGILPLALLLMAYFARHRFPLGLPGGLLAVLLGTAVAWLLAATGQTAFGGVAMSGENVRKGLDAVRWTPPQFWGGELWSDLADGTLGRLLVGYLAVSIPMGVMNVLGSLQNIESSEAGGDRFRTGPSLAVNGLGSLAAGLFGSCFPTTIYIGHPGWKALGARCGYSIVNGLFFTALFLFGLGPLLVALIPIEAGAAIVMYIGIIITAQAFQASPREHAPAVALALFPVLAAQLVVELGQALDVSGSSLEALYRSGDPRAALLPGMLALTGANSSWIVSTLILAAFGAALIDRRYRAAAVWCSVAAVLTAVGLLHSFLLRGSDLYGLFIWEALPAGAAANRALPIAISYALAAVILAATHRAARRSSSAADLPPNDDARAAPRAAADAPPA